MSDTTRSMLVALGVALVVVILVPTLFMGGMMGTMMNGGVMGSGAWVMLGLVLVNTYWSVELGSPCAE